MTSFEITGGELLPMRPVGIELAVEVQLFEEIDDARLSEALDRPAGLCVERHQLEPRRHENDALLLAVGPVRHAAMDLARCRIEAGALIGPPGPQRLARPGIGRNDRASRHQP